MKTIQQIVSELDSCKLVSKYMDLYVSLPFEEGDYSRIESSKHLSKLLYLVDLRKRITFIAKRLFDFIERIKTLKVEKSKDIIIGYYSSEYYDKIDTSLIHYDELIDKGDDCETYAYEFSTQEEIFGWRLPNTEFVQLNIYEIVASILYEASFFGYDQFALPEAKKAIKQSMEEIKSGDYECTSWEELKDELNLKNEDNTKVELRSQLISAESEYYDYLRKCELNEILKLIEEEQK